MDADTPPSPAAAAPGAAPASAVWRRLAFAAWLSLGIHMLAGLSMALILRHGLESNSHFDSRVSFLVEQRGLWLAGWFPWNLAALSILFFYAVFAQAHGRIAGATTSPFRLGVAFTVLAVLGDLTAEGIEMFWIPRNAQQLLLQLPRGASGNFSPDAVGAFLALHRRAVMLTGFGANMLYTISAMLLVWSTRRKYPAWVGLAGVGVGVGGLWLSAAVWMDSVQGMVISNAVLVPCIMAWQAGVALDARRRARRPEGRFDGGSSGEILARA